MFRHFHNGFENSGPNVSAGLTLVNLLKKTDSFETPVNEKINRTSYIILVGYEIHTQSHVLYRIGMGYGPGSPYIGNSDPSNGHNNFGGIFDYTYLDFGVGYNL